MIQETCIACDVVVVGSGLAGISAALSAANLGAQVVLVSDGQLCGGSSFSEATWGLGMVCEKTGTEIRGPESLFKALCDVGMDMNDLTLSEALIDGSAESIEFLRRIGATVLDPRAPHEREYVACFDHKVRDWHGFVGRSSRTGIAEALQLAGVRMLEHFDPLSLLEGDGRVCGLLGVVQQPEVPPLILHNLSKLVSIMSQSVILATGGCCGLYGHHVCPSSSRGVGHALALDAGARVTNLEFQQLMMGSLSPIEGIIFNEKLYRWSRFRGQDGNDAFISAGYDDKSAGQALEAHSWHGPFTASRTSRIVDEVIDAAALAGDPCSVVYDEAILGDAAPEFVKTYLSWLRDERGVDPRQPMRVRMFAHSSNGGIVIDRQARTGVRGLYACGECAGGVHGADRIGGLASLTAVTFGRIAGASAAGSVVQSDGSEILASTASKLVALDESLARRARESVGKILDDAAMVARSHDGLLNALGALEDLDSEVAAEAKQLAYAPGAWYEDTQLSQLCWGRDATARILMANAIVKACLKRSETRGPHYRIDCPQSDEALSAPFSYSLCDIRA